MLADSIIEAARTHAFARRLGVRFDAFAEELKRAQRYDLSQGVMLTAMTARDSPTDAKLKALRLARFPFALCWFEWACRELQERRGMDRSREMNAPIPRRMGVLATLDESLQRGTLDFAWEHDAHEGGANICPLRTNVDWREEYEPVDCITGKHDLSRDQILANVRRIADEEAGGTRRAAILRSSPDALIEDGERSGTDISPYWLDALDMIDKRDPGFAAKLMREAVKDTIGEADILRSTLMVINSRNLVAMTQRAMHPKVAAKREREGKPPLLAHTEITVRLSRALYARAGSGHDRNSPLLHAVGGHFKVRPSGVFWWNPHMRGDPQRGAAPHRPHRVKL